MIDRILLIEVALDESPSPYEQDIAGTAVDETINAVLGLLKAKRADYAERGNRIGVAVIDDIYKEFYT